MNSKTLHHHLTVKWWKVVLCGQKVSVKHDNSTKIRKRMHEKQEHVHISYSISICACVNGKYTYTHTCTYVHTLTKYANIITRS